MSNVKSLQNLCQEYTLFLMTISTQAHHVCIHNCSLYIITIKEKDYRCAQFGVWILEWTTIVEWCVLVCVSKNGHYERYVLKRDCITCSKNANQSSSNSLTYLGVPIIPFNNPIFFHCDNGFYTISKNFEESGYIVGWIC